MTTNERQTMKDGLESIRTAHKELLKRFADAIWLANYRLTRIHDTHVALIECRLDNRGLEDMVAALRGQLGDKGLDIELGNDLDVV